MSVVTVVATVESDHMPPRVKLDVTDVGSPNLFEATVTRLNPDGTTSPVRTFDGNPQILTTSGSNRVGTLYDYEMPYGQLVAYSTVETPTSLSVEVVADATQAWLIHVGVPEISTPILMRPGSLREETLGVAQGVFYPMGRAAPVVVTDGARRTAQSSITVLTQTLDELANLREILRDTGVLLLNVPAQLDYGIDTCYIAVGEVQVTRLFPYLPTPDRDVVLPFVVVDRPSGGSQAERSYADLLVYPTYTALMAAYSTYADLLAGP